MKSGHPFLSMLFRCWTIGRIFGVAVRIHWTFWILPLVALYLSWPFGVKGILFSEAFVFVLFSCVVMHEFGHILVARLFGIKTHDVIMTPLGGIARLREMAKDPWKEIAIAVAGPAVNVVIAGLLFVPVVALLMATNQPAEPTVPTTWPQFLAYVLALNIMLVLFNMLPAFPSDGGRVFRALLSLFLTRVKATQIAVVVGTFVAACIAIWGIYKEQYQVPFVAGLLAIFGQMELAMVKYEAVMREGLWVDSRLPSAEQAIVLVAPEPGFSGFTMDHRTNMWIEWRSGVPVRLCRVRGW